MAAADNDALRKACAVGDEKAVVTAIRDGADIDAQVRTRPAPKIAREFAR